MIIKLCVSLLLQAGKEVALITPRGSEYGDELSAAPDDNNTDSTRNSANADTDSTSNDTSITITENMKMILIVLIVVIVVIILVMIIVIVSLA